MSNLEYRDFTIASGASLSNALNCEGKELISVTMPAALTGTTLTVQVSDSTTGTFTAQYVNGDARSMTTAASYTHQFQPPVVASAVKIDTGSNEAAARTVKAAFRIFQ